ncbi:MAG: fumarate/nitrate reduction transcriptional regulator Fnr [Azoarcus sp.]|jgi:CRP/FNR family transcriptional regulator|nr:fumarate/nitrate reduction transcriptional regulator Fnr [Azoarcus sp.]
MKATAPVTPTVLKKSCSQCNLFELCLPLGIKDSDILRLDELVAVQRKIKRQQPLYRTGNPFEAIYAIRTGSFKSDILLEDGREQVTGFHMTGEILGLDGISTGLYSCNAIALEDSEVCVISYMKLEELARAIEGLQHQFHKVMSSEIVSDHSMMMLLGSMHANERLAAFLLNLSQRFTARGFSPTEFHLRMTREEIGSYLGLKLETVSRAFSFFQKEGLISVQQKHIRILDSDRLKKLIQHQASVR